MGSEMCIRDRIKADQVPELVIINKADAADPMVLARLRQREPHSVVVSAKTGEGMAEALAVIEGELPRPDVEFKALLPYQRGDLINRLHQHGEIASLEHTADGTIVHGRASTIGSAASALLMITSSGTWSALISANTSRTAASWPSGSGWEPSTTCRIRSESATSSSVDRNASTSWCGRCRTKPTVSLIV